MEETKRGIQNELYEAPETIVQELKSEGVICTSATMNGTFEEESI